MDLLRQSDPERVRVSPGCRRPFAVSAAVVLALAGILMVVRRPEPRCAREARRWFAAGGYNEADRALTEWCKRQPSSAEAFYLKARTALARNAPKHEVEEAFRLAREAKCGEEKLAILRALGNVKLRQYAKAEPVLRQAFLSQRGPDPQIDQELARTYIETFDVRRAAVVLDRWQRDAPSDPRPYLWRVEVDRRNGSLPEAIIQDYRAVLARDPNSAQARLGLANALSAQHRAAEARDEFAAYVRLRPDDVAGHLGAGRNAWELGDAGGAARHFDRALELDPRNAEAHRERANVALRQGAPSEALTHLDRAVSLDPFDIETRYARGHALARLGRRDEAEREQAAAKRLRKELHALDELKQRLIDQPNDPDIETQIARWMIDHGHDLEGVRWAEKVVRSDPGHTAANRLLADYHERAGNAGRANYYRLNADGNR